MEDIISKFEEIGYDGSFIDFIGEFNVIVPMNGSSETDFAEIVLYIHEAELYKIILRGEDGDELSLLTNMEEIGASGMTLEAYIRYIWGLHSNA